MPEMARCWCRKPSPGLVIEAALEVAHHHGEYYPPYMGLWWVTGRKTRNVRGWPGSTSSRRQTWRAQAKGDAA